MLHEKINERYQYVGYMTRVLRLCFRWEICVANSDGHFEQVSFVNSIWTMTGGTHVNYVADQISKRMIEEVKKKNKKMVIKPQLAKNQLWVFVNALVCQIVHRIRSWPNIYAFRLRIPRLIRKPKKL